MGHEPTSLLAEILLPAHGHVGTNITPECLSTAAAARPVRSTLSRAPPPDHDLLSCSLPMRGFAQTRGPMLRFADIGCSRCLILSAFPSKGPLARDKPHEVPHGFRSFDHLVDNELLFSASNSLYLSGRDKPMYPTADSDTTLLPGHRNQGPPSWIYCCALVPASPPMRARGASLRSVAAWLMYGTSPLSRLPGQSRRRSPQART